MSVPGDTRTTLLPHLTPLTRYEVSIQALYENGEKASLPVTGYETTLEGILCSLKTFTFVYSAGESILTRSHLLQNLAPCAT